MNKLSSFSGFALTRGEMKKVTGGLCHVCSWRQGGKKGGTCGGDVLSSSAAQLLSQNLNQGNDGYTYTYACS